MTDLPPTLSLYPDAVTIVDQTRLPREEVCLRFTTEDGLIEAIQRLQVRGAPALGAAAAAAAYLAARRLQGQTNYRTELQKALERIAAARPTAVNLPRAIHELKIVMSSLPCDEDIPHAFYRFTENLIREDREACAAMADRGADLLGRPGIRLLTICNSGSLATLGIGTAFGVIRRIAERFPVHVFASETRPLLQGARLTAYELTRLGIPFTLLPDNAAATLVARGEVDVILTGADRIAANGDTANKLGTLNLNVLSRTYGVPFYIVAPETTIDPITLTGDDIHIEERSADEVRKIAGVDLAPENCPVFNPAFDVTPGKDITGIITDCAIYHAPYRFKIS